MTCAAILASDRLVVTPENREVSKVTAIALIFISLAFLAVGAGLLGIGMTERYMAMGVGFVPHLAGYFCLSLAIGSLLCSAPFAFFQLRQ